MYIAIYEEGYNSGESNGQAFVGALRREAFWGVGATEWGVVLIEMPVLSPCNLSVVIAKHTPSTCSSTGPLHYILNPKP